MERSRNSSKCSEISTTSDKTCKSTNSNGYDTKNSIRGLPGKRSSQKMFKGFSDNSNNIKYNIDIINGLLNDLKSGTSEEKSAEDNGMSLTHISQDKLKLNSTKQQYLDAMGLHINRNDSIERTIDNLSSISKTDDEKLNEIISGENLKLNDKSSNNIRVKVTRRISITSKSDDEKLNETRTHIFKQEDDASLSKEKMRSRITRRNGRFIKKQKKSNEQSDQTCKDETISDDKDLSLSELRSILQKEAMDDDFSFDENSEVKYNLRKSKHSKLERWKQRTEDFNAMLSELSVSKFQLVADSVSSLRDLISTFSKNSNPSNDTDGEVRNHFTLLKVIFLSFFS